MSLKFGSNITSLGAQRALSNVSDRIGRAYERLSSGLRINRASDDAAGLAVSTSLKVDTRIYSQALRNGNDALSALSISESTLGQAANIVTRVLELATQSANGSFSRTQRVSLDKEGAELFEEFNRILRSSDFNGINLFDANLSGFGIQLGKGVNGSIFVELAKNLKHKKASWIGSSSSITPGTGMASASEELADLDGDGDLDLIAHASEASGVIKIYTNNGAGSFTNTSTVTTNASGSNLVVGDFNGDGKVDVAVGRSASISLYLGNGDGTLSSTAITTNTSTSIATTLRAADINGDGKLDLVGQNGTTISVFTGAGDGQFNFTQSFSNTGTVNTLQVIDLDGNGIMDIATATNTASVVRTYMGSGNGTFGSVNTTSIGGNASSIAFGDINHDGLVDVVVAKTTQLESYLGVGAGSFSSTANVSGAFAANDNQIALGDFDNDGILDLYSNTATIGSKTMLWSGNDDGTFTSIAVKDGPNGPLGKFVIGDLNGDGVNDVLGTGPTTSAISYHTFQTSDTINIARVDLTTQASARSALNSLSALFDKISQELGGIGAAQSRIVAGMNALYGMRENSEAAYGRISNADIAQESAEQVRLSILQQASAAVLTSANQQPALALKLLT